MSYSHHRRIFDIFYVKNPSKSTPNPKNVKPDTAIFYRVSLYDKTGFDLWLISGRTHTTPCFLSDPGKMIQTALEISPEISHQESALHQQLSRISFLSPLQPVRC